MASDLIRDIQTSIRRAAGVPLYDPRDLSLPSVPSIEEAVAAIDPFLPDYLCCKTCHGGLCRGINSTLCIFCGAEQRVEGMSRKISFNSTVGYQKFLQSLHLNGSEMVNLEAESKDSRADHDSPKGWITLSNLLDLELIWPRDVEESDNSSSSSMAPFQVAPVSSSGINLDSFFSDQKNEVFSRSTNSDTTRNTPQVSAAHDGNFLAVTSNSSISGTKNETATSAQNTTDAKFIPTEQGVNHHVNLFSRSQNIDFFKEQRSLDVVNSHSDDAFADWETDFQSASSVIFEDKSKPIDPFQYSTDYQYANSTVATAESIQMDPFQNSEEFQPANSTTTMKSVQIDQFQKSVDFQSTISTAAFMDSEPIDAFQNSANFQSAYSAAVAIESVQIDAFQNTSNIHSDNPTDLTMESSMINIFQNSSGFQSTNFEAVATECKFSDLFQNLSALQSTKSGMVGADSGCIDHLQNFFTEKSDQSTNTGHNASNYWFQDDMISHISTTILKKANQLESINSTFVGEVKNEEEETPSRVSWTRDDFWHRSSASEINNRKSRNHHDDDLVDDWQDFTSSTDALGMLSSFQSLTNERVHALSWEDKTGDLEDLEFGSFMQSESVSDTLNEIQKSSDVNSIEDCDSCAHRKDQSIENTGNSSTIYRGKDIDKNIPDASEYKLDMLLAQTPDLSFMLEESLFIPKKPSTSELNT